MKAVLIVWVAVWILGESVPAAVSNGTVPDLLMENLAVPRPMSPRERLHRASPRTTAGRDCPMTFNFLHEAYRACVFQLRPNGARSSQHKQVTIEDNILERFQEICSSRPRMERCKNIVLEGCSPHHLETFNNAVRKSFWFCNDDDDNIRGVMTRVLTGDVSNISSVEAKSDVLPKNQHQRVKNKNKISNPRSCLNESGTNSCPLTILARKRFVRIRNYGNIIEHHAHQVLSDPLGQEYFKELFHCYFQRVRVRCPLNALAMTILSQDHLFFPPNFGVNVSQLIIEKAAEIHDN